MSRTQIGYIGGPDETLTLIRRQLHLYDDTQHWCLLQQERHQVGAILRRLNVGEIR